MVQAKPPCLETRLSKILKAQLAPSPELECLGLVLLLGAMPSVQLSIRQTHRRSVELQSRMNQAVCLPAHHAQVIGIRSWLIAGRTEVPLSRVVTAGSQDKVSTGMHAGRAARYQGCQSQKP